VPLRGITEGNHDSACVLYWEERDLKPGEKRAIGFAYGLGNVSFNEGKGILAVTLGRGVIAPGEVFSVTAYVNNPRPDETLTLNLPEGFRLVEGGAIRDVPRSTPDAQNRRSVVTWKVSTDQANKYKLEVRSSRGVAQSQWVTVLGPRK
jgi:hypothetical protein